MLGFVQLVSGVKECFGGDASDVEAGATEGSSLLNAHSLESSLAGLDGGNVASRASTNDSHVVLGSKSHAGVREHVSLESSSKVF